jgi:cytochrome c oxidase subunit 2
MQLGAAIQSALAPAGPQSSSIQHLWQVMLAVSVIVFVLVLAFVLAALVHGLRRREPRVESPSTERTLSRSVAAAVGLTVVILVVLLVISISTGRTIQSLHASSAVTIAVTGHQWWWEVEYEDAIPSRRVLTANELHIPVGQPIVVKVTSRDVIHSFWVPNLQGKRDLIPGYTTAIWMQADRAGAFRGQCAEFCGLQHAHMAFDVVAESPSDFERWLEGRRLPAKEPDTADGLRGRDVFMNARCGVCHTVQGTEAHGQIAPDLTHVAARTTIGAGTLPNTREHLQSWVEDPQASKPGNQMPPNRLPSGDLDALLSYLEALR